MIDVYIHTISVYIYTEIGTKKQMEKGSGQKQIEKSNLSLYYLSKDSK